MAFCKGKTRFEGKDSTATDLGSALTNRYGFQRSSQLTADDFGVVWVINASICWERFCSSATSKFYIFIRDMSTQRMIQAYPMGASAYLIDDSNVHLKHDHYNKEHNKSEINYNIVCSSYALFANRNQTDMNMSPTAACLNGISD
jgi:hypothetical protein